MAIDFVNLFLALTNGTCTTKLVEGATTTSSITD
jgi:hypothetical protein